MRRPDSIPTPVQTGSGSMDTRAACRAGPAVSQPLAGDLRGTRMRWGFDAQGSSRDPEPRAITFDSRSLPFPKPTAFTHRLIGTTTAPVPGAEPAWGSGRRRPLEKPAGSDRGTRSCRGTGRCTAVTLRAWTRAFRAPWIKPRSGPATGGRDPWAAPPRVPIWERRKALRDNSRGNAWIRSGRSRAWHAASCAVC